MGDGAGAAAIRIALIVLATYRLTRLITVDAFPPVKRAREWIEDWKGPDSALAYLVNCAWCVSIYVGAIVVVAVDKLTNQGVAVPVAVWLSASAITGLIATIEPD